MTDPERAYLRLAGELVLRDAVMREAIAEAEAVYHAALMCDHCDGLPDGPHAPDCPRREED